MAETIGRYEIRKELGRGGMATVYLAHDPRFKRDVAIKVLPPQFTHDPKFLARFEQEAQTMTIVGTPSYMSPEQWQGGQKPDWRVDLYALGVLLFEMLTGNQPYQSHTPSQQMCNHIMEPVPDVLALNPELPPRAQDVINKAMAKEREDRYQSAGEMEPAWIVPRYCSMA